MNEQPGTRGRLEGAVAGRVIGMAMGVDDVSDSVLAPLYRGKDLIRVEGRIDQGTGFGSFFANEITKYGHSGQFDLLNFHGLYQYTR
jgi:hypothetical protein